MDRNASLFPDDSSADGSRSDASDWSADSPPAQTSPLLAPGPLQHAMHTMLAHLQNWWIDSEEVLQLLADKNLPCDQLKSMSDDIDKLLDKSIEKLVSDYDSDPITFPVTSLMGAAKNIKKYLFLKVGQICCQQGNQDKCASAAKKALKSLSKFKDSAGTFYDALVAQALQSKPDPGYDAVEPSLDKLFKQLRLDRDPPPDAVPRKKKSPKK
jgi:hypothetical protein